jgi:outer membrane protein OmpA-like peptidoglycan-associated protein
MIAEVVKQAIARYPAEVFLVEGHTDALGSDDDNLSRAARLVSRGRRVAIS